VVGREARDLRSPLGVGHFLDFLDLRLDAVLIIEGHDQLEEVVDIVELAAEVGIKPSFPIPDVLATRIATTEKFGIIPVPKGIVEKLGFTSSAPVTDSNIIPLHCGIPVNSLSQLSTRRVSAYKFLSECQQTAHAVVPVHTAGEFSLFKSMLKSGGFYKDTRGKQPIAANTS
jgi:hypothetical protein